MANPEKVAAVAELTERFTNSAGAVLTEYRGLTVAQLRELRGSLGEGATFAVVKNTLTKIAVERAGLERELSSLLSGPSAIAFVTGDVVETAKGLRDFARAHPLLVIKGGVLDGKALTPDEITRLADLEPREVLLAKLAGAMKASQAKAAAVFAALPTQMAQLAEALRVKQEAAGGSAGADATAAGDGADATAAGDGADAGPASDGADATAAGDGADAAAASDGAEAPAGPGEPQAGAAGAQAQTSDPQAPASVPDQD